MDEAEPQAAGGGISAADKDALGALRFGWGDAYEIGFDAERGYWALRRDGLGGDITAGDLDGLFEAIIEDYAVKPEGWSPAVRM
jgi:hypothetical protein